MERECVMNNRCLFPAVLGAILSSLALDLSAQGWWGWPPPPHQYYEPAPREEPQPRRRPARQRSQREKKKATPGEANNRRSSPPADSLSVMPLPRQTPAPDQLESANPHPRRGKTHHTSLVWDYGDSASRLARAAGISLDELLKENALTWKELREGQVLRVPRTGGEPDPLLTPERQRSREVWRGIRGKKRIALTFDAGSERDGLDELLSHLTEAEAPGTFFVTGQFVKKNPDDVRRIAEGGFPIYNHSWSHPEFTKLSDEAIGDELERTDRIVEETTGRPTTPYWRPPFGDRDKRVLRVAAEAGFQSIYWTIDTLDSVGERKSSDFVVDRVLNPAKGGSDPDRYLDGAIVLMHVGMPDTAAALPEMVRGLRERGFTLVTVDEILKP